MNTPIVLASASPRRRELLAYLGIAFTVVAPDIDETPLAGESPRAYVDRLALGKARAVESGDALVIAADTTIDLADEIIGKPVDEVDARTMLRKLSGRTHAVHTGVAVRRGERVSSAVVTSLVTLGELSDATIDWYVATGETLDKAGAYAIQGAGGVLVQSVSGNVSNIVGLPLPTVVELAAELGVPLAARS